MGRSRCVHGQDGQDVAMLIQNDAGAGEDADAGAGCRRRRGALWHVDVAWHVDAGAGESADEPLKTRDHACVCVCLTAPKQGTASPPQAAVYAGVVSWLSCGVSRITHASFDFEAVRAVSSLDLLANLREILGEVTISICPPRGAARDEWRKKLPVAQSFTDSMGLVKAVRLGVTSSLSNRRRRDILDLSSTISQQSSI